MSAGWSGPRSRERPPRRGPQHAKGAPSWVVGSAVAGATAVNVALGLYHLGVRSLWVDESYSWLISAQSISSIFAQQRSDGGHLFLYYALLHFLISWFGNSAVLLRLPSVIAGAASVPLVYVLTKRLANDRVAGLYAAWLFAVSAPLIFWQQNAREYAFIVLLAVGSSLVLVRAIQNGSRWGLVAWAAIIVVACYTNPQAAFLPAAQLLPLLLWPPARALVKSLVLSIVAGVVAAVIPIVAATLTDRGILLTRPTSAAGTGLATFLSSGANSQSAASGVGDWLTWLTALAWVLAAAMVVVAVSVGGRSKRTFGLGFGLSWLVVPPLLAWAISETVHPIFADRYLIVSLPAASVVVGMVLARIPPKFLAVGVLVVLMVLRSYVLATTYDRPVDNFAGATRSVLVNSQPHDCITFYLDDGRMLYDYYAARDQSGGALSLSLPDQVLPSELYTDVPVQVENYGTFSRTFLVSQQTPADVAATARWCTRLWFFEFDTGSSTGVSTAVKRRAGLEQFVSAIDTVYRLQSSTRFTGIDVLLFDRPALHSVPAAQQ